MVTGGKAMATFTTKATEALIDGFDGLFKTICYADGRLLYGVNIDARASECRIILKTFTNGRPEIAFINATSLERCIEIIEAFVDTNNKTGVVWRPDKYYKP
jgi:hypothetical protein